MAHAPKQSPELWHGLPSFPALECRWYYGTDRHDLRRQLRRTAGRDPAPSRGIVDSQSTPTAEAGGEVDFDTNKLIKGRKRFIITATMRLILTLMITHAAVSDTASAAVLEPRLGPEP